MLAKGFAKESLRVGGFSAADAKRFYHGHSGQSLWACPMLGQSSLGENVHWTFSVAAESARGTRP